MGPVNAGMHLKWPQPRVFLGRLRRRPEPEGPAFIRSIQWPEGHCSLRRDGVHRFPCLKGETRGALLSESSVPVRFFIYFPLPSVSIGESRFHNPHFQGTLSSRVRCQCAAPICSTIYH